MFFEQHNFYHKRNVLNISQKTGEVVFFDLQNLKKISAESKHAGGGKSGAIAPHANLTSVGDYDYHDEDMDESANA